LVRKVVEIAAIRLPAEDGRLLAEIYRGGNVLSQQNHDGEIVLRARIDQQLAGKLTRSCVTIAYPR